MKTCPFYDVGKELSLSVATGYCFLVNDPTSSSLLSRSIARGRGAAAMPFESLTVVLCSSLRTQRAHCVPVRSPSGVVGTYIVGAEVLASFENGNLLGRRRLLSEPPHPAAGRENGTTSTAEPAAGHGRSIESALIAIQALPRDDPGWAAHTDSLCAMVWADWHQRRGSGLGASDRHALRSCLYWRAVGNLTLRQYPGIGRVLNGSDAFLTSFDAAYAAVGTPGFALQLLQEPGAIAFVLGHSEWARPVVHGLRTAFDVLEDVTHVVDVLFAAGHANFTRRGNRTGARNPMARFRYGVPSDEEGRAHPTHAWSSMPLLAVWDRRVRPAVISALGSIPQRRASARRGWRRQGGTNSTSSPLSTSSAWAYLFGAADNALEGLLAADGPSSPRPVRRLLQVRLALSLSLSLSIPWTARAAGD